MKPPMNPPQPASRRPSGPFAVGRTCAPPAPLSPARRVLALAASAAVVVLVPLLGTGLVVDESYEVRLPGDGATALLRAVLLAALCVHLGELAGVRLARRVAGAPAGLPRPWAVRAAWAGVAAAVGQLLLVAGSGSPVAGLSGPALVEAYGTRPGLLALLEANAFLLAALCAASGRPGWAAVPLAAIVFGEALRAHPEPYTPETGTALTLVHLTATALWTGGLLYVLRTRWRWRHDAAAGRELLTRYARPAALLFAAITATGVCSTLRRLPLAETLATGYGRVLLAKLVLVLLVSGLALAARGRLRREAAVPGAATRPARAELVALAAVVLVSAVLTAVPLPPAPV
ncbi:CopD family protein [Streptomyces albofaciens]|uniref:CopD family protein n=1 Tax=Streptomyces albofaciens TaxID=66866 RepID=UPI001FCA7BED|nr:CopD family protein [Streptomyces albofaciens]